MKTPVYLVRHGEAVSSEQDPERPLSLDGHAEVMATARTLLAEGATVSEIWHSRKLRAKQTAEIIAGVLGVSAVVEKEGLLPDSDVVPIAEEIRKSGKCILLVAHNPFLIHLDFFLKIGTNEPALRELGTARVARVSVEVMPQKLQNN